VWITSIPQNAAPGITYGQKTAGIFLEQSRFGDARPGVVALLGIHQIRSYFRILRRYSNTMKSFSNFHCLCFAVYTDYGIIK
jgi:hypothetical protein